MNISDYDPEFLEKRPILDNKYRILDKIGEGRFAKVKMAFDLETNNNFAIKIMRDSQNTTVHKMENFIREVQLLADLNHHNIIEIVHVNLNGKIVKHDGRVIKVCYYLMKYAHYGELFKFLELTPHFSENISRFYFHQLIEGVEYLHRNHIGHRDVKAENLLLDQSFRLKIADFGYAAKFLDEKQEKILFSSTVSVGSPEYNAPEITNSNMFQTYSAEDADLFASATMLFTMVMKSAPFRSSNCQDPYYARLCNGDKSAFWKVFQTIYNPSDDFKGLIEKMLEFNAEKRLTLAEVKEHPWYKGYLPSIDEVLDEMKNRGQEVIEIQRNEMRRKREMKLNKMKYMRNYGNDLMDSKNYGTRPNPKLESLKQKYQATIEEINEKLAKKREVLIFKAESKDIKEPKIKMNLKEKATVFREKGELKKKEAANKKKNKKTRDSIRRRKKTQDDMSIPCGNNPLHISFLDDFQHNFTEESKKSTSNSPKESRRSIKSDNSGDLN